MAMTTLETNRLVAKIMHPHVLTCPLCNEGINMLVGFSHKHFSDVEENS